MHPGKLGALALSALASSTAFLASLGGTAVLSWREVAALLSTALLPTLMGYLLPVGDAPGGGTTSIDDTGLTLA